MCRTWVEGIGCGAGGRCRNGESGGKRRGVHPGGVDGGSTQELACMGGQDSEVAWRGARLGCALRDIRSYTGRLSGVC